MCNHVFIVLTLKSSNATVSLQRCSAKIMPCVELQSPHSYSVWSEAQGTHSAVPGRVQCAGSW
ncbi:hypothetical protein E2C01_065663 [Portunus trituberculatus]|uniref:Uncharacterized protein n=1 Tax=Portunus trituberculatus TaxID=210409 RepID=A0A5B7HN63_PORTR|nr:hypothetical protein [Portunus trituberculatus]